MTNLFVVGHDATLGPLKPFTRMHIAFHPIFHRTVFIACAQQYKWSWLKIIWSFTERSSSLVFYSMQVKVARYWHVAHTSVKIFGGLRLRNNYCICMQNLHSNAPEECLDFIRQWVWKPDLHNSVQSPRRSPRQKTRQNCKVSIRTLSDWGGFAVSKSTSKTTDSSLHA